MQRTPANYEIQVALDRAASAVEGARKVRARHRKHRKPNRARDLDAALARLDAAAGPVRRYSGMALAHDFAADTGRALREASAAIGAERRKLRKMLR